MCWGDDKNELALLDTAIDASSGEKKSPATLSVANVKNNINPDGSENCEMFDDISGELFSWFIWGEENDYDNNNNIDIFRSKSFVLLFSRKKIVEVYFLIAFRLFRKKR